MGKNINEVMASYNERVNTYLYGLLSGSDEDYPVIFDAMGYSVKNGGKRIRPFLVLKFSELAGAEPFSEPAMRFASALEMIHTYSLIHDDLPCMDNDDLRRGKPTNHKVYGEATATLAGDGLLTLAFETVSYSELSAEMKVEAIKALSRGAGVYGMVGGQVMDMLGEETKLSYAQFRKMNALKTGALIRCAASLGVIASGSKDKKLLADAVHYAECIGTAFQIRDDILDVTADEAVLGKPVGSDAENGKTTVMSYMSMNEAQALAEKLTKEAVLAISPYKGAESLCALADYLLIRNK